MTENSHNGLISLISDRFPTDDVETVVALLSEYGGKPHEREPARVRAAIVELSNGSIDRLLNLIAAAKTDYRDVLYWLDLETARKG